MTTSTCLLRMQKCIFTHSTRIRVSDIFITINLDRYTRIIGVVLYTRTCECLNLKPMYYKYLLFLSSAL